MINLKSEKSIALLIVLSTIMAIVILANLIMNMMLSQSRLTHHKVSRIQGYYAALAGTNLALNRLAAKTDPLWPAAGQYTRNICNTNAACSWPASAFVLNPCHYNEPTFPCSIRGVQIMVGAPGAGFQGTRTINSGAIYTYSEQ